jgi:hypothetical protein
VGRTERRLSLDEAVRGVGTGRGDAVGVVVVATTAVLVAASVLVAGLGSGASWVFEVLAATGLLVGLGVAFGALDRGRSARRWARRPQHEPPVPASLADDVAGRLARLDQVEHRRLDLGSPWPTVVVGPTGVFVVSVAARVVTPAIVRLEEVVLLASGVVSALEVDREVPVRGLLVVPPAETVAAASARVTSVTPDELDAAIAAGGLVPMSTVDRTFARLNGVLAPDLRIGA